MKVSIRPSRQRWAALRREAIRLGILVAAKASLGVKASQEALDELLEEAEALRALGETDDGLTDEQQARWDELLDEEKGEVAKAQKALAAAKRLDAQKKKIVSLRNSGDNPFDRRQASGDLDDGGSNPPRRNVRKPFNRCGRLKCFTGEDAADHAYHAGMWMLAVVGGLTGARDHDAEAFCEKHGLEIQRIQNTHTESEPGKGGYLAPEVIQTAFIERREAVGVLRKIMTIAAMTSEKMSQPKLLTGPAVIYPNEAGTPSVSDQTWGGIHLSAVKRMVYGKFSRELTRDAVINVVDQFVNRMAYELAKDEDRTGIKGDGTGAYAREVGLLNALGAASKSTATGHASWATLTLPDFHALMGILPDDYWMNPGWLCSASFYHIVMCSLMLAAGGNTIQMVETGWGPRPMFLGYPVYFTGQMPRTSASAQLCACFGDFNEGGLLGDRQGLEVAMSDDAHFGEDVTAVKGTTRIDANWHDVGDASNAGAVVGLVTG